PSTNHRARDFRYQHAEKSRLGDVQTQGDVFHHWPQALGYDHGSPRRRSSRSGSTRLDSQKDGLPSRSRLRHLVQGSRPSTRAQGGAAWSLPLSIGERNGRQENTRPCVEHAVFTSVFAALGTVFVLGAGAPKPWR